MLFRIGYRGLKKRFWRLKVGVYFIFRSFEWDNLKAAVFIMDFSRVHVLIFDFEKHQPFLWFISSSFSKWFLYVWVFLIKISPYSSSPYSCNIVSLESMNSMYTILFLNEKIMQKQGNIIHNLLRFYRECPKRVSVVGKT